MSSGSTPPPGAWPPPPPPDQPAPPPGTTGSGRAGPAAWVLAIAAIGVLGIGIAIGFVVASDDSDAPTDPSGAPIATSSTDPEPAPSAPASPATDPTTSPPAGTPDHHMMGITTSVFSPPPDAYPEQVIEVMISPDGRVVGGLLHGERYEGSCVEEFWVDADLTGVFDAAAGTVAGTWTGTVEYRVISGDCGDVPPVDTYDETGEWSATVDGSVPLMEGEVWVMNEPAILFSGGAFS